MGNITKPNQTNNNNRGTLLFLFFFDMAPLLRLEEVLSTRRYLAGDRMTLSDVRVFPSLVRFDEVYNVYFKCNKKRLADCPNILNYVRDLFQSFPEAFASTTDMDHIRVR